MNIKQYVPAGHKSWTAYYRKSAVVAKIKSALGGIFAIAVILGAYAVCGCIELGLL